VAAAHGFVQLPGAIRQGEVGDHRVDPPRAAGAQLAGGPFELGRVVRDHDQHMSVLGEAARDLEPDAARGAGDECKAVVHVHDFPPDAVI
jgi:hypothetical protein